MKYSLALTTFNRIDYLRTTLETLKNSDLTLAKEILIFDDGSTNDIIELLKEFKISAKIPVKIFINKTSLGANLNIVQSLYKIFKENDFAITLDSDSKFSPSWLNNLNDTITFCSDNNIDWGVISMFNTPNHKPVGYINDQLLIKKDVGSFGSVFRKDIFEKTLNNKKFSNIKTSFDWKYCWQCALDNKLIVCTKKTYIQHIGIEGTNSNINSVDVGIDFVEG